MDTRRCALFLIKCVQGFAAISRRWMTWKCNFQCLSLLLLAKAVFHSHASLYSFALEITFSEFPYMCACKSKTVCKKANTGCLHVIVLHLLLHFFDSACFWVATHLTNTQYSVMPPSVSLVKPYLHWSVLLPNYILCLMFSTCIPPINCTSLCI